MFYKKSRSCGDSLKWRRERDSNPRYGFPYTRFPGVHLQPLGHLSKVENFNYFQFSQHNMYSQSAQLQVILYWLLYRMSSIILAFLELFYSSRQKMVNEKYYHRHYLQQAEALLRNPNLKQRSLTYCPVHRHSSYLRQSSPS